MGTGFVSPGRIGATYSELATASDPHLPSVQRKIENADEDASNRQNGGGDVGIDKLIQIMEQKPALVGLRRQPWLRASSLSTVKGQGQGSSSVKNSPDK